MYGDNIFVAQSIVAPNNTRREYTDLLNGKSNRFLQIMLVVDVTIAGAVITSIKNQGHAACVFDEMGINEGGTDIAQGDPRLFAFASECFRPSAGSENTLTSTAIAANVPMRQMLRIYFEHPYAGNPRESAFLEKSVQSKLRFFIRFSPNAITNLTVPGAAVVTFPTVIIQLEQYFDDGEAALPLFRPQWDTVIQPIGAAGAAIPVYLPLDANTFLRGVTVMQTGTLGTVEDIINAMALRGDRYNYIGPQPMSFGDLVRSQEFEQGGSTFASYGAKYLHINMQKYGRLANLMTPVQDSNLRLVFDAQPGAGGAPNIVVLRHLLVRDPFVAPDGRRVTADEATFRAALPKV